jgi:hypothetical protein
MATTQGNTILPRDYTVKKLWDISKDLRKVAWNAEEEIFRLQNGRIGDIIEVFWDPSSDNLHVSESPPQLRFPGYPTLLGISQLFRTMPTLPHAVRFHSHNTILYFSPEMDSPNIEALIALINDEELSLIQRVAINLNGFYNMEKNALVRFSALREVILVDHDVKQGDKPQKGPLHETGPQEVCFFLVPTTAETEHGAPVMDVRTRAERQLDDIRKTTGAWPAGHVTVDVVWVARDEEGMVPEFETKEQREGRNKKAREKRERSEITDFISNGFGDLEDEDTESSAEGYEEEVDGIEALANKTKLVDSRDDPGKERELTVEEMKVLSDLDQRVEREQREKEELEEDWDKFDGGQE